MKRSVPSEEYWKDRAEQDLIANEKAALTYEKELRKAYQKALRAIELELKAFYSRFASEQEISLADARKYLNADELADFKQRAQQYLDAIEKLGGDPAYINELKKLSGRAYVSQLQEIMLHIRHNLEELATGFEQGLGDLLKTGYEDEFYKTVFDVNKQAKMGVSFTAPGQEQLERAVKTKWLGSNYSDRIWTNKNVLVRQLGQLMPQEFVRGRGPAQVARDLEKKLSISYNNAVRLVRTEMNHISNAATLDAYKASGVVKQYKFLATLDNRTSDICREMDGKLFKLSEAETGVNLPPLHPHCRSTTIPYFSDDEIAPLIADRIATNEDGQSYFVGDDVTFEQWVNKYAEASYAKRFKE